MGNNYAFIDGQNFFESTKRFHWRFSKRQFFNYLRTKYKIKKIFYFVGYKEEHKDTVYKKLIKQGLCLCFKKRIEYKDKDGNWRTKSNVDGKLIAKALIKFPEYDNVIIVAGDGDYYFLVQYLIRQKKLLKIYMPSKTKGSSIYYNKYVKPYISFISMRRDLFEYK